MKKTILGLFLILSLTSCVESFIVGSVAATGLVVREKSFLDTREDINILSKILAKFSAYGLKIPGNSVDVTINEQRVLLTGIVSDESLAKKAVELSWQVEGVKEVIDEIQISSDQSKISGFKSYGKDSFLSNAIEARAFFTKKVSLINVKVTTVNGVVYLLGVAKDDDEIARITKTVAKVRGVKKVVSHIIKIDDPRRND